MFGLGQVDTREVTSGEHHAFGVKATEIFVAKVVTLEFPVDFVRVYHFSRQPASADSARIR